MAMRHLKTARPQPPQAQADTSAVVRDLLAQLARDGEAAARDLACRMDGWDGPIVVDPDTVARLSATVPQALRDDIAWAHENIRRFAEAQRATCTDMQVDLRPGLTAGQRYIPLAVAGAYVPGGRYAHIASALMTITTAKVAGVAHVTAASPPRAGQGIPAPILYAMDLAGADHILALGGVQAVAAMAQGMFGARAADIIVGPGNQYVAEAKRQIFGPVGIDMFAGPTDSMVLADDSADPELVALDLVSQAEHGANSPVWLVTTSAALAEAVMARVPGCLAHLPEPNRSAATTAWAELAEVILCDTPEAMAVVADRIGPEHLHVQARDLGWWQSRLRAYGSLFLGEDTTVAFGDKAAGPNHVLPTSGAARYTGGLSVHKFLKCVTWQQVSGAALPDLARVTAHISRIEGMEGHARAAQIRLDKCDAMSRLATPRTG
ncbi:MAG TPA: histidinol dehydrogenase [Paracoccaceae bacterium]